ncbi:basic proline-rich protein-like [Oenanthe melanoleuca]|uniref:basic proline-rich protein-like n=1 Tax=Oenanthe melanoleuca TaxID=2939378 RepID=UPI0024C14754|nr:basic proline-rich protein-like [Oenanthe melanoleuca]
MIGAGAARSPALPFTGPLGARPSGDRHESQPERPPAAPPAAHDKGGRDRDPGPGSGGTRVPASPGAVPGAGARRRAPARGAAERPPRGSGARGGGGARPRPGAGAARRGWRHPGRARATRAAAAPFGAANKETPARAAPFRGRPGEGPAPRLPRAAPPLPVPPPPAGAALPARRGVRGTAPVPASGGGETYLCSARGHGSPGAAGAAGAAAAGARASPPLFVCEGPRAALSRDVTGPCVISAQGHRAPTRRGQRHPPPRGRGRGGRERGWGGRAARSSPVPWLPTPRPPRRCHWERARFPLETPRAPAPRAPRRPLGAARAEAPPPGGRAPAPRHAFPGTPRPHVGPPPLGDTAPRDGAGSRRGRGALAAGGRRRMAKALPPSALPGRAAPRGLAWTPRPAESGGGPRTCARGGGACPRQVAESTWPRAGTRSRVPPARLPNTHPPLASRRRQAATNPGGSGSSPASPAEGPPGSSPDPGRGRTGPVNPSPRRRARGSLSPGGLSGFLVTPGSSRPSIHPSLPVSLPLAGKPPASALAPSPLVPNQYRLISCPFAEVTETGLINYFYRCSLKCASGTTSENRL